MVNYWDKYTEMHGQQNVKKIQRVFALKVIVVYINEVTTLSTNIGLLPYIHKPGNRVKVT